MFSMTGYGSSKKDSERFGVFVEIKSVNHRFSEINIRMPRQLMKIDDKIKKVINKFINRGRIEVFVTIDGDGLSHKSLHIDWNLLDDYYQFINTLKQKYNFPDNIQLRDVLNGDFLEIVEKEDENEEIYQLVLDAVGEAVQNLKAMREVEGKELFQDLSYQIKHFNQRILYIKELAPLVVEQYQTKLQKRMNDLSDGVIDEGRLITEIGIFAEKADINEEITRLESHVSQFENTILLHEPIGRKLDFMIQEMNREVNTIGSKANHSKISSYVVELKTTLEKIREQVQNIE
ncbi:YicC family protein [Heyndrickxia vini]|uniref:YicC family protein n=2 Tax=Heyndrickxia vini TaxID=1476025 RepID=A0ABX7DYE2_9BACI|nr:YicC/YloC family endoribonuclease [Heyndrickxia vini]QQZ07999.1 YicC family protein [Heyndrickxia vini]